MEKEVLLAEAAEALGITKERMHMLVIESLKVYNMVEMGEPIEMTTIISKLKAAIPDLTIDEAIWCGFKIGNYFMS